MRRWVAGEVEFTLPDPAGAALRVTLEGVADALPLEGYDGVFHPAGQPGVRSFGDVFPLYVRQNVLASERLFEAAAAAGVRVAFASSSSIYGDADAYPTPESTTPAPISPYGITKLACEQLAHAYGSEFSLDVVTVRYFTIYGPRQRPDMAIHRFVRLMEADLPVTLYGDGTSQRDYTFYGDIVAGVTAAVNWVRGQDGFEETSDLFDELV